MDTRGREYLCYYLFLLLVILVPKIIGDVTFEGKLFVHDFSERLEDGRGVFKAFLYHMQLQLIPTIICFWLFRAIKKIEWQVITLFTSMWGVKDIITVIYCNNQTGTFWYDFIGYSSITIITLLWIQMAGKNIKS